MSNCVGVPRADPHEWEETSPTIRICKKCGREEISIEGRYKTYSGGVGYSPKLKNFPGACVDTTAWETTEKET